MCTEMQQLLLHTLPFNQVLWWGQAREAGLLIVDLKQTAQLSLWSCQELQHAQNAALGLKPESLKPCEPSLTTSRSVHS